MFDRSRNVVICCDGTGNEYSESNSNVVKLYTALVCDREQLTYHHPGVGTMGARTTLTPLGRWWTKVIGLAFGYGSRRWIAGRPVVLESFEQRLANTNVHYQPSNLPQQRSVVRDYCVD